MEKRTVINGGWFVLAVFWPIWIALAVIAFSYNELFVTAVLSIIGLVFLLFTFFIPYKYEFNNNGISFCFLRSKKVNYLWKNITHVACYTEYTSKGNKFFVYRINGKPENERKLHSKGSIAKTKKIKALFNEFIGDKVIDFTEIPKFRRNDPECDISKYILNLEKITREITERYVEPFYTEFNNLGLSFKVKFTYLSDADEEYVEYFYRPEGKSSYSAIFEIARPNETEKDMIIDWETTLVEVDTNKLRPKKFVESDMILISLNFLDNILADIKEYGFEKYMKNDFAESDE